ncbi:MAG: hypothetical protein HQK51_19225, partial [Oligoflexia bacterium]|nr:hypothetical protein [Oligoflexia bacterium]
NKSKGWVSARLTPLKELTPLLEKKIFLGQFPVWVAMGTLHQFKRLMKITNKEIDQFVEAVSNKNLSVRDIDLLAHGYFKGGDNIRSQIENGNLSWSINKMREFQENNYDYNEEEKQVLRDLEMVQKYIGRLIFKLPHLKTINSNFFSTAGIIAEGILSKQNKFNLVLNNFIQESKDDQPGKSKGGDGAS